MSIIIAKCIEHHSIKIECDYSRARIWKCSSVDLGLNFLELGISALLTTLNHGGEDHVHQTRWEISLEVYVGEASGVDVATFFMDLLYSEVFHSYTIGVFWVILMLNRSGDKKELLGLELVEILLDKRFSV